MPRRAEWLQHVPAALEQLRDFPAPVLDRAAIEKLLHLRRREAIRLLHKFGGYQAGRTFLVDKVDLQYHLESLAATDHFQREQRRRIKLGEELDRVRTELSARKVEIAAPQSAWSQRLASLPSNVRLLPGRLEVDFQSAEQLLASLFELAQAISNDFEEFQRVVEPTPGFATATVAP
jgi:hypothetical protein